MGAAHLAVLLDALEAADAPPSLNALAQYGVLGILCAALAWFGHRAYQREAQRADRLETENTRLHTVIQEQALPALLAATEVLGEYTELLREQRRGGRWREDRDDYSVLDQQRHRPPRGDYAPAAGPDDGARR